MNNNILVIGDPMIDIEVRLKKIGENPENTNVPKTKCVVNGFTLGGAANVALALKTLGANVHLLSPYGQNVDFLNALYEEGIMCFYEEYPDLLQSNPITIKTRFYVDNLPYLRVDADNSNKLNDDLCIKCVEQIKPDVILISDYNKGAVSDSLVPALREAFPDILIICDPKGSNSDKYIGCDFITPNEKEFNEFIHKFDEQKVILTRSSQGINYMLYNSPALNPNPINVCGAGDVVAAVIARFLPKNPTFEKIKETIDLANKAASISVSHNEKYHPTLEEINNV